MRKKTIKERAGALLTLVRELVETPGLTWVAASNAIYAPGGPFGRLFPTEAERIAFGNSREGQQIDDLIGSLPEPSVRPMPKEYSGKFNVRIPKSLHAALVCEAEAEGGEPQSARGRQARAALADEVTARFRAPLAA